MKPNRFDYVRATSVAEAVQSLNDDGNARILAGGLSLVPMMNFRLLHPDTLVDISGIDELRYTKVVSGRLVIGAATTQADLQAWRGLSETVPLLSEALGYVGHYQTRNRGTVCGSIAHADPSSELPLTIATVGGEVELRSVNGRRILSAREFQTGMLTTAIQPGEMVTAVRFPLKDSAAGYAFDEFARRKGDFAVVCVSAVVTADTIRLGVGGVAEKPTIREWRGIGDSELPAALNDFAWDLGGSSDIHATARYRRELVRRLGARTIERARRCLD